MSQSTGSFADTFIYRSWKKAYECLTNIQLADSSTSLGPFLSDPETVDALVKCLDIPQAPNGQTRSDFETRTAAINVIPSDSGRYDINQIREDVRWLSGQAKIDELSALRLVLLEWQQRPAHFICANYTEEELISLREAAGASGSLRISLSARSSARDSSSVKRSNGSSLDFNSPQKRRSRLYEIYLSEREALLAVSTFLEASGSLKEPLSPYSRKGRVFERPAWISDLGARVSNTRGKRKHTSLKQGNDIVHQAIEAARRHLKAVEDVAGMSEKISGHFDARQTERYAEQELYCIPRLMQFIYVCVSSHPSNCSSFAISSWFKFVDEYGFFQNFEAVGHSNAKRRRIEEHADCPVQPRFIQNDTSQQIQLLCSLVSFQILRFQEASEQLNPDSRPRDPSSASAVVDASCQRQVSEALLNAADGSLAIAAPATLAWSFMLQSLRTASATNQDRRDSYGSDDGRLRRDSSSPTIVRDFQYNAPRHLADANDALRDLESMLQVDQDPIEFLAHVALDMLQVFPTIATLVANLDIAFGTLLDASIDYSVRSSFLALLRQGCTISSYSPDILEAALSLLRRDRSSSSGDNFCQRVNVDISNAFLADSNILVPRILQQSQSRYPYELEPYLQLCQCLSASSNMTSDDYPMLTQYLMNATRFTQTLPRNLRDTELVGEEDSPNRVTLSEDLYMLEKPSSKRQRGLASTADRTVVRVPEGQEFFIPARTIGNVVSERPLVVMWNHTHSAFAYLGALLSTALARTTRFDLATGGPPEPEVQAGIIGLLTSQMQRSHHDPYAPEYRTVCQSVLDESKELLSQDRDMISVISELLEEMLSGRSQSPRENVVEILTSCVSFLKAVLPIHPGRIWPMLARSQLLDTENQSGQLASVVASLEIITGRFDFLIACMHLYQGLVDDVIRNAVARRAPSKSLVSRFNDDQVGPISGVAQKSMSGVLLGFTRIFLDFLRSSQDLKFTQLEQRLHINTTLMTTFQDILMYVYAFDDTQEPASKLTGAFAPSAKFLSESFISTGNEANLNPLFRIIASASKSGKDVSATAMNGKILREARTAVNLLDALVALSTFQNSLTASLTRKLFSVVPALIRLYVSSEPAKAPIIQLLTSLTKHAARSSSEPPALLGHLNPEVAYHTLHVLTDLNKPVNDPGLETKIWGFSASVINGKQKWLATYLLTGRTPRDSLSKKDGDANAPTRLNPMLGIALDSVSALTALDTSCAAAMLKFISNAQNEWPWTTATIKSHANFLHSMTDHMETPPSPTQGGGRKSADQETLRAIRTESVAILTEIFAMYLHNMRQLGDSSFVQTLTTKLGFLQHSGVADPEYDGSLHAHLQSNFEKALPGCTPMNFKKLFGAGSRRADLGPSYFYDMQLADAILASQSSWRGRGGGFSADLVRANSNLSLMEAQVQCLISWKLLAGELSVNIAHSTSLHKALGYVAYECLVANARSSLSGQIFDQLRTARIEMALMILQRLVAARSTVQVMTSILHGAWDALSSSEITFDVAFERDDAQYARSLLQTLYLTLQPYIYMPLSTSNASTSTNQPPRGGFPAPPTDTSTLVPILQSTISTIIPQSFTSLSSLLHDSPRLVQPTDIPLQTALLHSILSISFAKPKHPDFAIALAQSTVPRTATALFSWSDRLTLQPGNDPFFAEQSIVFLAELASLPALAQYMAVEGILARLDAAGIMNLFRYADTSRSQRAGLMRETHARLHRVWTRGILPLVLNLLAGVREPPFALEAVLFLNGYSAQVERAVAALSPTSDKGMTFALASEIHTLALIAAALGRCRAQPSEVVVGTLEGWDGNGVREDLEGWVGNREALGERVDGGERDVETVERELVGALTVVRESV